MDTYRRNRIRHEVLPRLQEFNPRIVEGLGRTAEILTGDAQLLDEIEQERWPTVLAGASAGRIVLYGDRLASYPLALQRRMIRRAWAAVRGNAAGLAFHHVNMILSGALEAAESGMLLPGHIRVSRSGGNLIFERDQESEPMPSWASGVVIPVPGGVTLDGGRRIQAEAGTGTPTWEPGTDRSVFNVDAARAGKTFVLRSWQPGDWFCPTDMGGHRKKLQDFFVDLKIPRVLRHRVPLVAAPAGIVWIAGYRGDERFRAIPGSSHIVRFSDERPAT
jgi:tRNA(Ile)-lysidine synthase